jgi:hypothetical protein
MDRVAGKEIGASQWKPVQLGMAATYEIGDQQSRIG